jgi:hypothetical protein
LSNASVSEVAANTTTVPDTFPAAGELPEEEDPLDDELHAASRSAATAAHAAIKSAGRRPCGGRDGRRSSRAPDGGTVCRLLASMPSSCRGSHIMPTSRSQPPE